MSYAVSQNGTPLKMLECPAADCPPDGPSLDVIRQIIKEEKAAGPVAPQQHLLPELAPQHELSETPRRRTARRKTRRLPNPLAPLARRLSGFQPSWRLSALLLLAAVVIAWPWLIPGGIALVALTLVIAWLTLGPDRATEMAAGGYARFARHFPKQAAAMSATARRIAARLPERWTGSVAGADADADPETQAKMARDPFDRLASEMNRA